MMVENDAAAGASSQHALPFLDGQSARRRNGALSGAPIERQRHACINQSILKFITKFRDLPESVFVRA